MADIRKVGLLTMRDGRVLLCRTRKHGKPLILPGGKRESGESSMETLLRELREELGEVELLEPVSLGVFVATSAGAKRGNPQNVEIELFGGQLSGEPKASSEIAELVWFGEGDDWELLAPSLSMVIFPALRARKLLW